MAVSFNTQAAALKREVSSGSYARQSIIDRCIKLQAQMVGLPQDKTKEAFAALKEIYAILSSSNFSEKLKGFRERVVKLETLAEIRPPQELQAELEALVHLEKELVKQKDLKSENASEFAELMRRRQVIAAKVQASLRPSVFKSLIPQINLDLFRILGRAGVFASCGIFTKFYFRPSWDETIPLTLYSFLVVRWALRDLADACKKFGETVDLIKGFKPIFHALGKVFGPLLFPVLGKECGLSVITAERITMYLMILSLMSDSFKPILTGNRKSLIGRIVPAVSFGIIGKTFGLPLDSSLLLTWMGAYLFYETINIAPIRQVVRGSLEVQAANVLAQFFYDNFSSQLTSQRIDEARNETTVSDELMQLGRSLTMPSDLTAYLGSLEKVTRAKKVPSGVVITNASKAKSFSIGLDVDQKGNFVVALLDPSKSSCDYFKTVEDAALKARELIRGKDQWHLRQAIYKQPEDPILLGPIPRFAQVKIGKKIGDVKSEMTRFISENKNLSTFSVAYTFDELCDLFRKACIYFAPKNTNRPLRVQDLANCFLDSFKLPTNEDDALKAFVSAITLNGQNRMMIFKSERERKEAFRQLVIPSGRFSKEDLDTLFPSTAGQDDIGERYQVGEIRVFDTLPKTGIWKKVRQTFNLTTLRYMGPSRTFVLR